MTDKPGYVVRRDFIRGSLLVAGAVAFPSLLSACSRTTSTPSAASLDELIQQRVRGGAKRGLSVFLGGEDYIAASPNYTAFGMAQPQGDPVIGAIAKVWIAPDAGSNGAPSGPIGAEWSPYSKPDAPSPAPQGLNSAELTFATAGVWQMLVEVEVAGERLLGTAAVQVKPKTQASTLLPGARALSTRTPTVADPAGVHPICTRTPPCPFHAVTLANAITLGKPTLFMVATPSFCMSRTCGPNLEELVLVANEIGDRASFIHAEVYRSDNPEDIQRQVPSPAFAQWKMQSEPWLFVIDADAKIATRFEGPVVAPQIKAALEPLSA